MNINFEISTIIYGSRFYSLLVIVTKLLYMLVIFKYMLHHFNIDTSIKKYVCFMSKLSGEHSS